VIDDLELWRDESNSLFDNVRAVIQFIHAESDRIFMIVASSKLMQEHLDKRLPFSTSFSTLIHLNKATLDEVCNAVLLRHGGSHRFLVKKDKQPISTLELKKKVHKLCKHFDYNMGEVLQAWAYMTTMVDDNQVVFEEDGNGFADFFTSEEIVILKHIVLYKYLNEFTLKRFLGNRYTLAYDVGLKRMANTKVLLRAEAGQLKLNPVIARDINDILKYRGTFN